MIPASITLPSTINNPISGVSDSAAFQSNILSNMSAREQLLYLIDNDSDNSTAWKEALNTYDQNEYFRSTEVSNMMKQLEENNINPILAYNMINGYSPNVSSAKASSLEAENKATDQSAKNAIVSGIFSLLGTLIGGVIKGYAGASTAKAITSRYK